jgi:hypothetical protein
MSREQYGVACVPAGQAIGGLPGILTSEPTHVQCSGGETIPGLIGGWTCPCECHRRPSPHVLWQQAEREHPDDIDALRRRYRELMVEHGHLIPGKQEPLPCGWSPSQEAASTTYAPVSDENANSRIAGDEVVR